MQKNICILLAIACFCFSLNSQAQKNNELPVQTITALSPHWLALQQTKDSIQNNDVLNEQILDLVQLLIVDSVMTKKTQRHRVAGKATMLIELLGFNWRVIETEKQKYIGTSSRWTGIPNELFKEYDLNFDIVPHLDPYINLAHQGYLAQKKINKGTCKQRKAFKKNSPPYTLPNDDTDLQVYKVHCELTPATPEYWPALDTLFYPTLTKNELEEHHNFSSNAPSIGMYGPFVSDCNHSCHPEIHPYEWIWWLNLDKNQSIDREVKQWIVGLFTDGSYRLRDWQQGPRSGSIEIPFVFELNKSDSLLVHIKHLVHNETFDGSSIAKVNLPNQAEKMNYTEKTYTLKHPQLEGKIIQLTTNKMIDQEGLQMAFKNLDYDENKQLISGYLYLAASVSHLYTAEITFKQ